MNHSSLSYLRSEVTVPSLNSGGENMEFVLFIDTQLGPGDADFTFSFFSMAFEMLQSQIR